MLSSSSVSLNENSALSPRERELSLLSEVETKVGGGTAMLIVFFILVELLGAGARAGTTGETEALRFSDFSLRRVEERVPGVPGIVRAWRVESQGFGIRVTSESEYATLQF